MNTPSLPFRKALIMNSGSTRPVHMSRIFRIYGIYCSLETPAKSAAEYPHQLQRKPRTLGLNSNPALIRIHLLHQSTVAYTPAISLPSLLPPTPEPQRRSGPTPLHPYSAAGRLSLIHISEPTRLRRISYAVFCLKKKK